MAKKTANEMTITPHSRHDVTGDLDSCFNRAADDEPIFILRANDETAPQLVRAWAEKYHEAKGRGMSDNDAQLAKYNQAYEIARAMEAWKLAEVQRWSTGATEGADHTER